ncbi:hypothetical protein RU97_GL000703 [Enterococcus canis]|uniref:Uncharacterized protein n=1 Tax=Enterococcus canis TaxID=214095 RepID=A0A1L8RHH0_9ENTE|nr:hypothetical protein [Enterococcus canis]OJG19132.1 hypothetical protein RU97_GL000703 [Enterococcus canis]
MFFKKKAKELEERDIWGRLPLQIYEKVGLTIPRSAKNLRRTPEGRVIHDYFVLFEQAKPDVRGHRDLLQSALWISYSSKSYRIDTLESKEELSRLLTASFNLQEGTDFMISDTALDPRFSLFT